MVRLITNENDPQLQANIKLYVCVCYCTVQYMQNISPSCRAAASSTAAWGNSSECGWTSSRGSTREASILPLRA